MLQSFDSAASEIDLAGSDRFVVAFHQLNCVGTRDGLISELNLWACVYPCRCYTRHVTMTSVRLRASVFGQLVAGLRLAVIFCPSSPLDPMALQGTTVPGPKGAASPTYTAITGAVDHSSAVNKDGQTNQHRARGIQSQGGVLVPHAFKGFHDIADGSSNTLMVGEQSDWCFDAGGAKVNCRSDYGHSFTMGTTPESYTSDDRWFNTTTVRYGVNHKAWNSTGVGEDYYACNRPIQSAHPGGAQVLLSDGSARFLAQTLAVQTFYDLVNRDDGHPLPAF